jgi:tetratricopeptide (TPR) repeat protein
LDLDPLNELVQQFYGMTLRFERRYEDGLAHARQVLQTNPNSPSAWIALVENLYQLRRYDESLAAQRRLREPDPEPAVHQRGAPPADVPGHRRAGESRRDIRRPPVMATTPPPRRDCRARRDFG